MTCQGNTRLLMLVEWCTKQEGRPNTPSIANVDICCNMQKNSRVMVTVSTVKVGVVLSSPS